MILLDAMRVAGLVAAGAALGLLISLWIEISVSKKENNND
jgi:hypothetical protein